MLELAPVEGPCEKEKNKKRMKKGRRISFLILGSLISQLMTFDIFTLVMACSIHTTEFDQS